MNAGAVVFLLVLCAVVAWYAARDGWQVDVSKGWTVFLALTTVLFFGLWVAEGWIGDARYRRLLDLTRSVAAVAAVSGEKVDSAHATMRALTATPDSIREAVRRMGR